MSHPFNQPTNGGTAPQGQPQAPVYEQPAQYAAPTYADSAQQAPASQYPAPAYTGVPAPAPQPAAATQYVVPAWLSKANNFLTSLAVLGIVSLFLPVFTDSDGRYSFFDKDLPMNAVAVAIAFVILLIAANIHRVVRRYEARLAGGIVGIIVALFGLFQIWHMWSEAKPVVDAAGLSLGRGFFMVVVVCILTLITGAIVAIPFEKFATKHNVATF